VVTIVVGAPGICKSFVVHEAALVERSKFFEIALDRSSTSQRDRTISIQEHNPHTFVVYLQAVYAGHLEPDPNETLLIWQKYARHEYLYVLAEYLRDDKTKAMVVAEIGKEPPVHHTDLPEFLQMVGMIYGKTTDTCPVRALLVEMMLRSCSCMIQLEGAEAFQKLWKDVPKDFAVDCLFASW
jgi:hypothetical protein